MANYIVYLGGKDIAHVSGTEYAYAVYRKALELADLLNDGICLVDAKTGEIIADNLAEDEDYEPVDIDDDCGFDPYLECYDFDC